METQKNKSRGLATKETGKAIVQYKGTPITITFDDVKRYICPLATDQEAVIFLKTAQSLQLNPFAREIYLIKYGEGDKAATVIAIDSYLKSAEVNDNFNGFEAGIILKDSGGKLEFREGSLVLPDETDKLMGGWSRVYRRDRERSFYIAVNRAECLRYTKDGNLTRFWAKEKQPSMLRKVALKRALVEAFPSLFAGILSNVEAEYEVMPDDVSEVVPKPRGETPEGELPPAYEKNGEAYWVLWWVRQKERGLTEDDVHSILGISSLKADWVEKGRTLEEAEGVITASLPFIIRTRKLGLSITQIHDILGISLNEWLSQGKTMDEAIRVISERLAKKGAGVATPAQKEAEGDLFAEGEKAGVAAPAEAEKQLTGAAAPAKPKRDPNTVKTLGELYTACHQDWPEQFKDRRSVWVELGFTSQEEIKDIPADCYRKIAAARA